MGKLKLETFASFFSRTEHNMKGSRYLEIMLVPTFQVRGPED